MLSACKAAIPEISSMYHQLTGERLDKLQDRTGSVAKAMDQLIAATGQ